MNAGAMNRRVTVEFPVYETEAGFGPRLVRWDPLCDPFMAEVQDVMPSRSEAVRQGLAQARNQTRIRIRWRGDIDSTMRIVLHGDTDKVLQIVGGPAEIGGRKVALEMVCELYSTTGAAT